MNDIKLSRFTEFSPNYYKFLEPKDIYNCVLEDGFEPNLYFILGVKKYYFTNNTKILDSKEGKISIELKSSDNDIVNCITKCIDKKSEKPYENLNIKISEDKQTLIVNGVDNYPAHHFYFNQNEKIVKFNVLYIGKSVGSEKKHKNSILRLMSHDKLQKALACEKDQEIYLTVFDINQRDLYTNLGSYDDAKFTTNLKVEELYDFPSKSDLVSFVEAVLINYFKPLYNSDYVNSIVPSKSHASYTDFYLKFYESSIINLSIFGDVLFYTEIMNFYSARQVIQSKVLSDIDPLNFIDKNMNI